MIKADTVCGLFKLIQNFFQDKLVEKAGTDNQSLTLVTNKGNSLTNSRLNSDITSDISSKRTAQPLAIDDNSSSVSNFSDMIEKVTKLLESQDLNSTKNELKTLKHQ